MDTTYRYVCLGCELMLISSQTVSAPCPHCNGELQRMDTTDIDYREILEQLRNVTKEIDAKTRELETLEQRRAAITRRMDQKLGQLTQMRALVS